MLWDLNEGKHLYTLDGGDIINALCFSPNRYWLCAATGPSIKIWVRHRSVLSPFLSLSGQGSSRRLAFGLSWVWSRLRGRDPYFGSQISEEEHPQYGLVPQPRRVAAAIGQSCCAVMKQFRCYLTAFLCGNPEAVSE